MQYTAVPLQEGAPLRTVTVRDTIADLPPITNGASLEEMSYTSMLLLLSIVAFSQTTQHPTRTSPCRPLSLFPSSPFFCRNVLSFLSFCHPVCLLACQLFFLALDSLSRLLRGEKGGKREKKRKAIEGTKTCGKLRRHCIQYPALSQSSYSMSAP